MVETVGKEVAQRMQVEVVKIRPEFTKHEKSVLEGDGAEVFHLWPDETLESQKKEGFHFLYIAEDREDVRFRRLKSREMQVAIYINPPKFFIQDDSDKHKDSFNKPMIAQKELLRIDAERLRKRLELPNIGEILPEVSEATQVIFQHFDHTRERILGSRYRMLYIRTGTLTDKSGFLGALVGDWCDVAGIHVRSWPVNVKYPHVGVARWIVPIDGFRLQEEILPHGLVSSQLNSIGSAQKVSDPY